MIYLFKSEEENPTYGALLIHYKRDFEDDNHEWREAVDRFIELANEFGYSTQAIDIPPFEPHEDFVGMIYEINRVRVVFSCDSLLSLVLVEADSNEMLVPLWQRIGKKTGWAEDYFSTPKKRWWEFWK